MRLVRVGDPGQEIPGVLVSKDTVIDVSDVVTDFDGEFFARDDIVDLREIVDRRASEGRGEKLAGRRLGAPIARPHQIVCVGLNYRQHAVETGQEIPTEPILFSKSANTIVGPNDDVIIPRGAKKLDWEVELGVIIGSRLSYSDSLEQAHAAIAGYTLVNDVSERAFQLEHGGQWLKGKSAETFNPTGPWVLTSDEAPAPSSQRIWLDVNGVRRQDASTEDMIFDPAELVHYISQFLVLEPGDLINTGTPSGVGMGFAPPIWLRAGDTVRLGIDGLGIQLQTIRER